MNTDKIKLFAIAFLSLFAVALGTQSCSDDAGNIRAEAVGLTPGSTVMLVNTSTTLVATVYPIEATDKGVTWASDNPPVATVDGNGLVSALSEGTAIITATATGNGYRKKTCTVTVIGTLNVSLNVSTLGMRAGTTRMLKAAILPDNLDQTVTWTSDNPAVATVDDGGAVTAIVPGTAKITAASVIDASRTAACTVTVLDVSAIPGRPLAGLWTFDDGNDPGKATIGASLIRQGDGFAFVEGPGAGNGAVRVAKGSYFRVPHGIAANGGGSRVNNYTVLFDFKVSELGRYYSFIQTTLENNDDAEFFLRSAGNLGIGGTGYSEHVVSAGEWHRLVLSASMGNFYLTYLDGTLIHEGNVGSAAIDSRFSFMPEGVLLFADDDGEDAEIDIAEVMIWDGALDAGQVQSLGPVR
ncbi:MAG: Ig-like domain-containing protein [Tannerella sp.]|jgi:hypothetical protein|nr:Ig-like domain-containing protein [Tannerella sp.]